MLSRTGREKLLEQVDAAEWANQSHFIDFYILVLYSES